MSFDVARITRQLDTDTAAVTQRAQPDAMETATTETLRPLFEGPGKYLSTEEKFKARKNAETEYIEQTARALAELDRLVRDVTPELEASIRDAQELPVTPLARWLQTKGRSDHSAEEWLLSSIRSEMVRSRLDSELKTASASTVARTYLAAIAEGDVEVTRPHRRQGARRLVSDAERG